MSALTALAVVIVLIVLLAWLLRDMRGRAMPWPVKARAAPARIQILADSRRTEERLIAIQQASREETRRMDMLTVDVTVRKRAVNGH